MRSFIQKERNDYCFSLKLLISFKWSYNCWIFFPANFFIGWHGSFKICDEDYCSANSGVIRVLIISMVSISMLHYLVSADLTFPYDSFP